MSVSLAIEISMSAAPEQWGESALLSFQSDHATIHINEEQDIIRQIQKAARKLSTMGIPEITLTGELWQTEWRWAANQGFYNPKTGANVNWGEVSEQEASLLDTRKLATEWVREMINKTPEDLGPSQLALQAAEFLSELDSKHITYRFVNGEELLKQGYVGIYNVGRGSVRQGAMLQLDYNPTGNPDAPYDVALVGKGITFDSGGYSLKGNDGMSVMKSDMGGAATVTGALALAITQGLKKRVKLLLCCAENLVSGHAFKLGDIIQYKNGVSVEILNTDAEGRLVLADGLIAACELNAKVIIDAATLTGAAKMAVGRDYNSILSMDDDLVHKTLTCAREENEQAWPLPLAPWHTEQIGSAFADIANSGSAEGTAGASTAAAFLSKFVTHPEKNWLHFDLSGAYQKSPNDLWAAGGKGHGVRTIAKLLLEL
ncbi:aminopeptidase PepB [Motilimonas cestriensis]|uniref:Aminopeptidase PepB n=1 Tax=Motilimonas cestriensis TaxID=2742685 RepID=A0ABS8W7X1_9GAMM|nr:aminopeptidase PepB [Motilimonas cestriensis]MCE2594580.1 aminopeptidase PepB [Motilimonas cestriensis]